MICTQRLFGSEGRTLSKPPFNFLRVSSLFSAARVGEQERFKAPWLLTTLGDFVSGNPEISSCPAVSTGVAAASAGLDVVP